MPEPLTPGTGQVCPVELGGCGCRINAPESRSQVRPGVYMHLHCAFRRNST